MKFYQLKTKKKYSKSNKNLKLKKTNKLKLKLKPKFKSQKGGEPVNSNNENQFIERIVKLFSEANFDYNFDEKCKTNEDLKKLFNKETYCHIAFLNLLKKVKIGLMLFNNNKSVSRNYTNDEKKNDY